MASVGYSNVSDASTGSAKRSVSGAFNQLGPGLVRELKEAFTLIDKDGDDVISDMDLHEILGSLGQTPDPEVVHAMLSEMHGPVTLSAFLTTMAAYLSEISAKEDLVQAFEAFESSNGQVKCSDLRDALLQQGMSSDEIDMVLSRFTKSSGFAGDVFLHKEFINQLRGE